MPKELTHFRTRTRKLFDLENGKRQAVIYAGPIHFQDKGAWYDYDLEWEESGGLWRPRATDFRPSVQGDLVSLTTPLGHTVTYQIPQHQATTLAAPARLGVTSTVGDLKIWLAAGGINQSITVPVSHGSTWTIPFPVQLSAGGVFEQVTAKQVDAVWPDERVSWWCMKSSARTAHPMTCSGYRWWQASFVFP